MIMAIENMVQIQGNPTCVMTELTSILRSTKEVLTETFGEKAGSELYSKIIEVADLTDEELDEKCKKIEEEVKKMKEEKRE